MERLSPLWCVAAYCGILLGAGLFPWMAAGPTADRLEAAAKALRVVVLAFCGAALVLWFSLPSTPSLATFGYPGAANEIAEPGRLLHFLQDYNRAIVRTTEVVHWLIFLFVFGLVAPSLAILTPVLHSRAAASHTEAIDTQPR